MELPEVEKMPDSPSEMIVVKGNRKLLPVAIMAHNEEKVIQRAIESVLGQDVPMGYALIVLVVANGCGDRTERIVQDLEQTYPENVRLISIVEKGKARALNEVIKVLDEISRDVQTPYVVFLDADCQFIGETNLTCFVKQLEQNNRLCAVAADCLPDVLLNSRNDLVAETYRAIYSFSNSLKGNSISGMCYGIRLDVLMRMDFPSFQFAEDMYVCSRVNGRFLKDTNIKVVFGTPQDLRSEMKRRTRQEISTQRYHEYYSYLKSNNIRLRLFDTSLGRAYEWGRTDDESMLKVWVRQKGLRSKSFLLVYAFIRLWARVNAYFTLRKLSKQRGFDYWKVQR